MLLSRLPCLTCRLATGPWRRAAVALSLMAALAADARPAGQAVQRQAKGNQARGILGYTVDVDTRWSEQGGYRPVRVKITPAEALSVERPFTVVLKFWAPRYYRGGGGSTTVEKRVVIPEAPENSQPPPTEVSISVPQTDVWERYDIEFWENGEHRAELDLRNQFLGNAGGWWPGRRLQWNEPLALEVDSKSGTAAAFPQQNLNSGGRGQSTMSYGGGQTFSGFDLKLATIEPGLLPEQWIDLTSVDVVVLSGVELERLIAAAPRRWQALREWVAAGGNLWLREVLPPRPPQGTKPKAAKDGPDEVSRLASIERLLDLPPLAAGAAAWQTDEIGKGRPLGLGLVLLVVEGDRAGIGPQPVQFSGGQRIDLWLSTSTSPGTTSPGTTSPNTPGAVLSSASFDTSRLSWDTRMGMADPTSDFWNFIIPGVGRVPLYTFLGLMTCFVIVIGPLNYIYLRRCAKLHLMIITVPLCAAAVTLGLFAYALISDGLGVRVRVRSYTEIDQRRGEAVCWSRLCYYAGLAPSQGLTFSGDVAVLPIAGESEGRRDETRQVSWTKDGQQHLSSGWLRSRTLTQYYTARSRRSDARIEIDAQGGGLTVTNQLGTPVEQLLVCDAGGKLHYGDNLASGATAQLTAAADPPEATRALLEAFRNNRLQLRRHHGRRAGHASAGHRREAAGQRADISCRLAAGTPGVWPDGSPPAGDRRQSGAAQLRGDRRALPGDRTGHPLGRGRGRLPRGGW